MFPDWTTVNDCLENEFVGPPLADLDISKPMGENDRGCAETSNVRDRAISAR